MRHKYISTQSNKILSYFYGKNRPYFEASEAVIALPYSNQSAIRELLSDMVKRGLLLRLKRGLYYIIPYEKESEKFIPDWHLLAEPLTMGNRHYIGYYSAMEIHNLITQPSLKEQIVVSRQMKPSNILIKGITFQFIYHNRVHFFGERQMWINDFERVKCSDLEKTIVDCLFKPNYAGGIVEVAKAIYTSRERLNYSKLLDYSEKFRSQAVIKRLGFLLEVLGLGEEIRQKLQSRKTASSVLLDTELPKSGKLISRWSIQQNLGIETIKKAMFT